MTAATFRCHHYIDWINLCSKLGSACYIADQSGGSKKQDNGDHSPKHDKVTLCVKLAYTSGQLWGDGKAQRSGRVRASYPAVPGSNMSAGINIITEPQYIDSTAF